MHCKEKNVSFTIPSSVIRSQLNITFIIFNIMKFVSLIANSPREVLWSLCNYLNPYSQLVKYNCSCLVDHLSTQAYKITVWSLGKQSRRKMSAAVIGNIVSKTKLPEVYFQN